MMSEQMLNFLLTFGYLGILVATYFEHLLPLLPTQIIIPLAGWLVGQHRLEFESVLLSASLGGVLGSYTLYWLGSHTQESTLYRYAEWVNLSDARFKSFMVALDRYGELALFASHLMPLTPSRMIFSVLAGMKRLSWIRFLLWASGGTIPWLAVQIYVSAYVGDHWQEVLTQPQWLLVLAVLLVVGWLLWRLIQRKSAFETDESALPSK